MNANDHISSIDIEQDIEDTEQEIAQMEREAEYYDKSPVGSPSYRLDHMRADARRSGIRERKEFIAKLQAILDERAQERHQTGCICADCSGAELTADND